MMIPDALRDEVRELMSRHKVAAALGWSKIHSKLVHHKLSQRKRLTPEEIGVSPRNRSGTLADVNKAHDIGSDIIEQGFVLEKTSGATCFVMPTSAKDKRHATEVNSYRFAI